MTDGKHKVVLQEIFHEAEQYAKVSIVEGNTEYSAGGQVKI